MIIRPAESGYVLITQPDHAHLARRIMEHCVSLVENPRRDSILRAIRDHDEGWRECDEAPTVDMRTGDVVDFIHAPVSVRQAVWPRAVAALADDPWAAALVANHALFAYDRFRGDAAWTQFFAGLEASRAEMLQASSGSADLLEADYAFLRLGDLISLAFCTGTVAPQTFRQWTVQLVGPRVVVTPGIFGGAPVTFEVRARAVRPPFETDKELREALARSVTALLQGEAT